MCQALLAQAYRVHVRQARVSPVGSTSRAEGAACTVVREQLEAATGPGGRTGVIRLCPPEVAVTAAWRDGGSVGQMQSALQAQRLTDCGLCLRDNQRKGGLSTRVAGQATCQEGVCRPLMSLGRDPG